MSRTHAIVPLALAIAVSLAPAAQARQHQTGGGGGTQATQAMPKGMLPGGVTLKGQIDHAYGEAVHAQAALAMGANDMANNHLSNVKIILSHLTQEDSTVESSLRNKVATLRQATDAINISGDRTQALKNAADLVNRFSSFYEQTASAAFMGGGGGAGRAMISPMEAIAEGTFAASRVQSAVAGRNWEVASLQARYMSDNLDVAEREITGKGTKAHADEIASIKSLRQEATKLSEAVTSRSENALKLSGTMVANLGSMLPKIAAASSGGGAGE